MFNESQHYKYSSLRENIVEHLFVGLALKELWSHGVVDVEILRSEFDAYGYDLVVSRGNLVRHIQLKSGISLKSVALSQFLAERPSGCLIFIGLDYALNMTSFWFYGAEPGRPLPAINELKPTKRATANSQGIKPLRMNHRDVPPSAFTKLDNLSQVLEVLLGVNLREE